jgi:hypothetical protein
MDRYQVASARRADIEANLEQVKNQLVELEKAGQIKPTTNGAVLRVIHVSDKGLSPAEAVTAWRNEANLVREEWIKAAIDPAEQALRSLSPTLRVPLMNTIEGRISWQTRV